MGGVKRLDGRVTILKGGVNKATGRSRLDLITFMNVMLI